MSMPWKEAQKNLTTADIKALKKLSADHPLETCLEQGDKSSAFPLCLKLYQFGKSIPLSSIVPMLENMGLLTDTESSRQILLENGQPVSINQLDVGCEDHALTDPLASANLFSESIAAIRNGLCENDGLNRLTLSAGLSWREITILRAYTRYLHQIRFHFTRPFIQKTLASHSDITRDLVELFQLRFGQKPGGETEAAAKTLESRLTSRLDAVTSLDEDSVLRRFWQLIKATLRTSYFQKSCDSLSLKLDSAAIPDMPLPRPLYEIFVYSPRFEGIHLRKAKIARGGIRWSDRNEDFRTEILGLMKAQHVKNAIIVPSGAKGGFVLKTNPLPTDRSGLQKEVVACYQSFIRGLLNLTDNLSGEKTIPPKDVICYDEPDPYLVVAADKGTASFSDIANAISAEYDFWLGDAFASGGSAGYDHKKIGITARGAWESVKRHFRELDVDPEKTSISVTGIGDMSGDVFGNGMIYTPKIRLIAAFDHRDIFLDPDPDPEKSFRERKRMFKLPTSSWQDYNRKLISKGGGVYPRSAKSITLSTEIRKQLAITETALTPVELIRAILKAPVDLLYNGGIGTYVKASTESNADAGDRANDFCRINGEELRCKVVCEGGNLGFTQQGRIEYALQGGLINADFIDNSAGVDCSDHEVNLKILLNREVTSKKLTLKKRDQILESMTDAVAHDVLQDNYDQALTMSFSAHHAAHYLPLYQTVIRNLEVEAELNRAVEFLPDDKKLQERKAADIGLTRPELAIVLAYTKIHIKNAILKSSLTDESWCTCVLENAFPEKIRKSFHLQLTKHPLRREIIATSLANDLVNTMGITFVFRLQSETGMSVADVVRGWAISNRIYKVTAMQKEIDALGLKIPCQLQFELLHHTRQLLNLATRWLLRENRLHANLDHLVLHYSKSIATLEKLVPNLMSGLAKEYLANTEATFKSLNLPENLAHRIVISRVMYTALNVTEVAMHHRLDLMPTAAVYFEAGTQFGLVWFRDQIATDNREGHWNNRARLALREDLDNLQRRLCMVILQHEKKHQKSFPPAQLVSGWIENHSDVFQRWEKMLTTVQSSTVLDYTLFFIALRELWSLIAESKTA